jgi:hypothetical protein
MSVDVHTAQETHLWASTSCYVDTFTFLYVDDVRTLQETHVWAFMACFRDGFTFIYVDDVRASQETPMGLYGLVQGRFHLFTWKYYMTNLS